MSNRMNQSQDTTTKIDCTICRLDAKDFYPYEVKDHPHDEMLRDNQKIDDGRERWLLQTSSKKLLPLTCTSVNIICPC